MKRVFKNDEVAHIWARQSQNDGRNSANNIYFNGKQIYSYGSHFCMGRILDINTVLITDRTYSNTTAKHINWTRYAVNHMDRIYVPYPEKEGLEKNLQDWQYRIKNLLDVIKAPRRRQATRDNAKAGLSEIVATVNKYLEVTNQSLKVSRNDWTSTKEVKRDFKMFFEAAQSEQAAEQLTKKLDRAAKLKEKKRLQQLEERRKKQRAILMKWKRGANVQTWYFDSIEEVHLRAKFDNVESSKGARVTLKAARILYTLIKAGKDIKGHDLEGYTVIGINGTLKIGCHEIPRTEVERFAKSQNW